MSKKLHLTPRERQEVVDNIVNKLKPLLRQYVEEVVGEFAITEEDVAKRLVGMMSQIEPRWFFRFFFTKWCLPKDADVTGDGSMEPTS